jgi:O-6-methylguanine DNA methyltransferase
LEKIYYRSFKTPLGQSWAASSDKGLIRFNISTQRDSFVKEIKETFSCRLIKDKKIFDELEAWLKGYVKGEKERYKGHLDLRGTKFQRDIWKEVYSIPYGRLSSYGLLALKVGRPKAYRAAGNAVGANPCGLIIPCHRVIKSNGGLGGFGSGLDLKRKLLSMEGVLPHKEVGAEDSVNLKGYFNR